ncbi:GNAT family N-acetyltransferase [Variovorax rhizosphaerae]|uniref:GNAT family N-acetyltransferase n=1 Tax=Variovorax rhizosphaerae TaxID=1836200 RepID=A0ABU8WCN3_9BURK
MRIRAFRPGDDEAALRAVFRSSVHQLAVGFYTPAQLEAWAPEAYDAIAWAERLRANRPFVAEVEGRVAGFADLQPSGYIDHFFVDGTFGGRGVGSALMAHLHQSAHARGIGRLCSDVSLSAEGFFARCGFVIERRQEVELRGEVLRNARMRKTLGTAGRA